MVLILIGKFYQASPTTPVFYVAKVCRQRPSSTTIYVQTAMRHIRIGSIRRIPHLGGLRVTVFQSEYKVVCSSASEPLQSLQWSVCDAARSNHRILTLSSPDNAEHSFTRLLAYIQEVPQHRLPAVSRLHFSRS